MLSPDVRIEGFDARDWLALGDLLGGGLPVSAGAPVGGLFLLVEGDRALKLVSTHRGRLVPPENAGAPLDALARKHGARWVLRARRGALETLVDRVGERLQRGDDFTDQMLTVARVLRELSLEGSITLYPKDARGWAVPRRATIDRALDVVCPVGKTLLFAGFEGSDVATSIALRRGLRGFDRMVGPVEARSEMGLRSESWARDCRGFARAVELAVGPIALGAFAQMATWRRLLGTSTPGRWTAALAAKDLVVHPAAPAVAIPVSIDLGRAAIALGRDVAHRLGLSAGAGSRAISDALSKFRDSGPGHDVERLLGFDPFALLSELLTLFNEDR